MDPFSRLKRVVGIDMALGNAGYPGWEDAERLIDQERYAEAEPLLERAVSELRQRRSGSSEEALVLLTLAKCQWKRRLLERAQESAESAHNLLNRDRRSLEALAVCLELRASIQKALKDPDGALAFYREALEVQQQLPVDAFVLTHRYRDVAAALNETDPEQAEELMREAVEIARAREGAESALVAECLMDLGRIQALNGDRNGALETLQEADAIESAEYPGATGKITYVLSSVASDLVAAGDNEAALRYYDQALKICECRVGGDVSHHATLLVGAAEAHTSSGNDAAALESLMHAVARLGGRGTEQLAETLEELAECCTRLGRLKEAIANYERARQIWGRDPESNDERLDANMVYLVALKSYLPSPKPARSARRNASQHADAQRAEQPRKEATNGTHPAPVPAPQVQAPAARSNEPGPGLEKAAASRPKLPPATFRPPVRPVERPRPGGMHVSFVTPDGSPVTAPNGKGGGDLHLTIVVPVGTTGNEVHAEARTQEKVSLSMAPHKMLRGWEELEFDLLGS